jgi:hypothetical protein
MFDWSLQQKEHTNNSSISPYSKCEVLNLRKHISCLPDADTKFSPGTIMKLLSFFIVRHLLDQTQCQLHSFETYLIVILIVILFHPLRYTCSIGHVGSD